MMSSLYIGATGMIALGEGMSTISNNLANLNTVGYKERLHLFEDLMSTGVTAPSNASNDGIGPTNYSQLGHGSVTSAIISRFYENGALETTNTVTNLAINGKGFFQVSSENGSFYTRAGNFYFNNEGWLVHPSGMKLMGKRLSNGNVSGALEAVRLDPATEMYMPAKATSKASIISNLGMTEARTTNASNPFFSLALSYNSAADPLMGASGYSNSLMIYDSNGRQHELEINYDLVEHNGDGRKIIQYTVSIPPDEDGRAGFEGTVGAGLLLSGTMTFTSNGQLQNMSAFAPSSGADIHNLNTWTSLAVGADGIPLDLTFINRDNAGNPVTASQSMKLDFGLGFDSPAGMQAAGIGQDPNNLPGYTGAGNIAPETGLQNRTHAYNGEVSTISRSNDGYAEGYMQGIRIDKKGVLSVRYDNGQELEKFQIPLYTFQGEQNLKAEGNNLYSATKESGAAIEGMADSGNLGSIISRSLEMSNVDIARQFTYMIVNQRGFQFNSKVITVSDSMLQKALELKRA